MPLKTPTLSFTVLALLFVLAHGASLHAQSQPPTTACPTEGPSIEDTLRYINDMIEPAVDVSSDGVGTSQASVTIEGNELVEKVFARDRDGTGNWQQWRLFVYQADCHSGIPIPMRDGYSISVNCNDGRLCVRTLVHQNDGTWAASLAWGYIVFHVPGDRDHADRIGRAFSHLVGLLQQQYKQSHSDPNDPFAKPQ